VQRVCEEEAERLGCGCIVVVTSAFLFPVFRHTTQCARLPYHQWYYRGALYLCPSIYPRPRARPSPPYSDTCWNAARTTADLSATYLLASLSDFESISTTGPGLWTSARRTTRFETHIPPPMGIDRSIRHRL
jgi:hypothetical protein